MNKYEELYPQSFSDGIGLISDISSIQGVPWDMLSSEDVASLERAYSIRSGIKVVSNSFYKIPAANRATTIYSMFIDKWRRYWSLYHADYDPLAAYIVEETGKKNKSSDGSNTTTYGKKEITNSADTGTVEQLNDSVTTYGKKTATTTSDSGDVSTEESTNSDGSDFIYAFNSSGEVPSEKSTSNDTSETVETRNLTTSENVTDSGSDNETSVNTETRNLSNERDTTFSGSDSTSSNNEESENYEVNKKGNIGYSTPQKMLREEFILWEHPFFNIVFSDIDKMIMLKIYN